MHSADPHALEHLAQGLLAFPGFRSPVVTVATIAATSIAAIRVVVYAISALVRQTTRLVEAITGLCAAISGLILALRTLLATLRPKNRSKGSPRSRPKR